MNSETKIAHAANYAQLLSFHGPNNGIFIAENGVIPSIHL